MKFELNWPVKIMFKYIDGSIDERPWLKGQKSTLTF